MVLVMVPANPAAASVGLPYTATITYITGGSGGVGTPVFYTNSTAKICVKTNLSVTRNANNPASNDNRYVVKIIRDLLADRVDKTIPFTTSDDNYKVCVTGLDKNAAYFAKWEKVKRVDQQRLGGSGTITYS